MRRSPCQLGSSIQACFACVSELPVWPSSSRPMRDRYCAIPSRSIVVYIVAWVIAPPQPNMVIWQFSWLAPHS